jgi:hypothetical protein
MPYCPRCGVELEEKEKSCPLCDTPIILEPVDIQSSYPEDNIDTIKSEELPFSVKRKFAIEILSLVLGIAAISVMFIEFRFQARLWWSLYPVSVFFFAWTATLLPLFFYKKPYLLSMLMIMNLSMLLLFFDLLDTNVSWFLPLGLPIIGYTSVVVVLVIMFVFWSSRKGFNIASYILLGIGLLCLGYEMIIHYFLFQEIELIWSPIVFLSILPPAALTMYAHSRIRNPNFLKRFFHF